MKVEIEISEKALNLVVAQCMAMADSKEEEQGVKKAEERCKEATVKINPESLGKEVFELQVGLAMVAIAQVADDIEKEEREKEKQE